VEKGDDNNRIKGELRLLFPPLFPPSLYVLFKLILVLEGRAAAKDEGGRSDACRMQSVRKTENTTDNSDATSQTSYKILLSTKIN
jgi:hypothetical protein